MHVCDELNNHEIQNAFYIELNLGKLIPVCGSMQGLLQGFIVQAFVNFECCQ